MRKIFVIVPLMTSLWAIPAFAQTENRPNLEPEVIDTIPRAFERAFFQNSGDFYLNRNIARQTQFVFGIGYPETEIEADSNLINGIYRQVLEQQTTSDPYLRSPDLRNPFDTSIRLLPSSPSIRSGDFFLERQPQP